jgi:heat shock protein HslJ
MRVTRGRSWVLGALVIGLALVGCDGESSLNQQLEGRTFLLQSADGFEPVMDTTVRISFESDRFAFNAGCNHYGGDYELRDGRLVLGTFGSTEIGCDTPRHEQDEWLSDFFGAKPSLTLDGETLTVTGDDATLVFLDREVADPDRPLAGTTWTVDTFIEGGGASNLPLDPAPTLLFREDGSLMVDSGCNTSGGSYTVDGNEITLSDIAFTEKACPGAAGSADMRVQAVIRDGTLHFEIEAGRLTLMRDDVGLGALN